MKPKLLCSLTVWPAPAALDSINSSTACKVAVLYICGMTKHCTIQVDACHATLVSIVLFGAVRACRLTITHIVDTNQHEASVLRAVILQRIAHCNPHINTVSSSLQQLPSYTSTTVHRPAYLNEPCTNCSAPLIDDNAPAAQSGSQTCRSQRCTDW
jgi:hypothetical protein